MFYERRLRGEESAASAPSFPYFLKVRSILIYHPAFIKYVFDNWLQGHGRYPSTGILSVIFSLHICDEVGRPLPCARLAAGGRELLIA